MTANIRITDDEINVIENSDFFISKNIVSTKIKLLFGGVRDALKEETQECPGLFPEGTDIATGRIFQGENYKLLPYILLDYPKMFSTTSVFAFRTMFWWGRHFSCTLHLEGIALEAFRETISKNIRDLSGKGFYFCVHHSPWEYYFDEDNYLPLELIADLEDQVAKRKFIKLSRKLELKKWSDMQPFTIESFKILLNALK